LFLNLGTRSYRLIEEFAMPLFVATIPLALESKQQCIFAS
jgi:hypothetical protein